MPAIVFAYLHVLLTTFTYLYLLPAHIYFLADFLLSFHLSTWTSKLVLFPPLAPPLAPPPSHSSSAIPTYRQRHEQYLQSVRDKNPYNKMTCLKGHTQVPFYAISFVGESIFKSLYLYTILFSWSKLHQGYVSRWLCLLYVSYTFAWAGNGMFPLGLGLAVEDNPFMYPHDSSCTCCQIFSSPFLSVCSP